MQARDLPPEAGWFLAGVLAGQEQDAAAAPGLLCHAGGHRAPQLSGREEVAEEERLDQLGLQLPKKPKSDIGAIVFLVVEARAWEVSCGDLGSLEAVTCFVFVHS